jgi:hypothetical protein
MVTRNKLGGSGGAAIWKALAGPPTSEGINHVKPLKGFRILIMRTSQTRLLGSAPLRLVFPQY